MDILIVGCGKLGARLADNLLKCGHNVSVVDRSEESFKVLGEDFDGITVVGMPMDIGTLKNAGIESCDAVAAVTNDDNLNITVSQIAQEFFGIENVMAVITDPLREKVFNELGLKTICGTKLTCSSILAALEEIPSNKQVNFGSCALSFFTREVDSIIIGKKLNELPSRNGEAVIGILDETGELSIRSEDIISNSDRILCVRLVT